MYMNIYQKLAEIRRAVDIVQKDESGYGYKYVSEAQLLPIITGKMDELGLTLFPGIVPGTISVTPYSYTKGSGQKTQTVNQFIIKAESYYTWVNNDDPSEQIKVPWAIIGNQSDSSQAFGSALTYGERYFLLKFFQSATVDDDPDKIRSEQKKRQNKSDLSIVLSDVDSFVQELVASNPDVRDEVKGIISEYVDLRDEKGNLIPTGDYFKITKKARAMALLKALKDKYKKD